MTNSDSPWSDSRFWVLQLAVLAIALLRLSAVILFHLHVDSVLLASTTLVLYVLPALYAGLVFGLNGAVVTTAWITVLGVGALAYTRTAVATEIIVFEVVQLLLLVAVGMFTGWRVTVERHAREEAEQLHQQDLRAEALYRDLFDSNRSPILIVDGEGLVSEINAAAQTLFAGGVVVGRRLTDVLGPRAASQLLGVLVTTTLGSTREQPAEYDLISMWTADEQVVLRPSAAMLDRLGRGRRMQVVLEDVTSEVRRRDQIEAYAAQVIRGQEEERRHIAQELHDGPLQSLILVCRQIDTLAAEERGRGLPMLGTSTTTELAPSGIAETLALRHTVEEAVEELRSIAKGLRPSILDDLGLVAGINQLVVELSKRGRVRASFGLAGEERRLTSPLELTLFRIAQEALSNVDKHAKASMVAVGLNFDDTGVRLLVKDDGAGIPTGLATGSVTTESLGLPGMRERAGLVGGRLVIHSSAGQGTTIDAWVPSPV